MDSVLDLHRELLARTGGTPGILNLGAVDSALYRAQWGPFLGLPDLADRAALLLRGLCQDHPFADGNKRTAFMASYVLLDLNGWTLAATPEEATTFMLQVAQDQVDLEQIADWLRAHSRKD